MANDLNIQVNTFAGGMNMDADPMFIPEGMYRYAENIRVLANDSGTGGCLLNIERIKEYKIDNKVSDEADNFDKQTILGIASFDSKQYNDEKRSFTNVNTTVVLTKRTKNDKTYNILWKVYGFESETLTAEPILRGYLDINKEVSIVSGYESEKIIQIYICDGEHTLKIINIANEYPNEITDPQYFDINPGCILEPFHLTEMISGTLPSGVIQYCYQLFKKNGTETPTSPLSARIPITANGESSKTTNGYNQNEISDKGCKLKATAFNDGRFDKLRVISIQYLSNTSTPKIYIISETDIPSSSADGMFTFEYVDTGSGYLKELTQEEFNDLIPFEFVPQTIVNMQNRLFTANLKELTWDIDYDARAYRSNYDGVVMLQSSTGEYINTPMINILSKKVVIPEDHDCINPMNKQLTYPVEKSVDEYAWVTTEDSKYRGGKGLNVSYKFVTIDLIESEQSFIDDSTAEGLRLKYDAELDVKSRAVSSIKLHNPELSNYSKSVNFTNELSKIRNYSDPYFVTNFLSYQRDEVYRFGIIFYNSKSIPTPVHWIGDIRFPSLDVLGYNTFDYNKGLDGDTSKKYELLSHPIGIEFTVNNLPEEVKYYEIVRCDRSESDRSVVTQGLLNRTVKFNGWHHDGGDNINYETSNGSLDRRPFLHPNFSTYCHYGWRDGRTDYNNDVNGRIGMASDTSGIFDFVSADVCFNKSQLIVKQNMYIVPLYCATSKTEIYARDVSGNGAPVGGCGISIRNTTPSHNFDHHQVFGAIWMPMTMLGFRPTYDGYFFLDRQEVEPDNSDYGPQGGLLKYYMMFDKKYANKENVNTRSAYIIEDSTIATNINQNVTSWIGDIKGTNIDYVGNSMFTNTPVGSEFTWGPGGVKTVLYSPDVYNGNIHYSGIENTPFDYKRTVGVPAFSSEKTVVHRFGSVLTANIKQNVTQYGGDTYNLRAQSIYSNVVSHQQEDGSLICFGGDTFLGVLDYSHCLINSTNTGTKNAMYVGAYIPLESVVNVYYRSDSHFSLSTSGSGDNISANVGYMTDPGQVGELAVQLKPMYTYNAAYSKDTGGKRYIQKSLYAEDNIESMNRITCSEVKTSGEQINSWSLFKFANYLDVDEKYGPITNLKVMNNKLYYFLDNAVGIASVNDRSLITDENASKLVLGTGDILSRYDYVTIGNGTSVINDKSIVCSKNILYWYDLDKNEICQLGNGFQILSKVKSVQSYLNSIGLKNRENVVSLYDQKYNEVWFRIKDKSLIFNEMLGAFTSMYTHSPEYVSNFSNYLVTIKNNNFFYLHNVYDIASEDKEEMISKVLFVVNKDAAFTKVFDNVSFDAEFTDYDNETPQVVKEVVFQTKTQQTDAITADNIENREDNYRFAIPREKQNDVADLYINKSYAGRMRGKYLICNYTFDCNNGREMKIPFIKTTYRYSIL